MKKAYIFRLRISSCPACGAERSIYPDHVRCCPVCGVSDRVTDMPDPLARKDEAEESA
jgi:hypothetical protein